MRPRAGVGRRPPACGFAGAAPAPCPRVAAPAARDGDAQRAQRGVKRSLTVARAVHGERRATVRSSSQVSCARPRYARTRSCCTHLTFPSNPTLIATRHVCARAQLLLTMLIGDGALARSRVRVAGWQANVERAHGIEDELIVECTVEAA